MSNGVGKEHGFACILFQCLQSKPARLCASDIISISEAKAMMSGVEGRGSSLGRGISMAPATYV